MNRRIWLLLSTAFLAALVIIGLANAASASLPTAAVSVGSGQGSTTTSQTAQSKDDPFVTNFNCADIPSYHMDQQMNIRASLIMQKCGLAGKSQSQSIQSQVKSSVGSSASVGSGVPAIDQLSRPLLPMLGGTDKDIILPDGTYPHIIQSESYVYGHGSTIVVNYNDSRTAPGCYAGLSYSTDSGATWHEEQPFCTGHGTNFGDPIVVWDNMHGHWVGGDLATGCGGQGIGFWTSPDGMTWTTGSCINIPAGDGDRESMYVDNNPSSPNYGTMFVSYANYALAGPPITMNRSTDGGATWSAPLNLALPGGVTFMRNTQDTGGPNGAFFIAGMDENGGALNGRTNYVYHSTDGGVTWSTPVQVGPLHFPAPGVAISGYFALFFPTIWRYEGWGQPAAGPGGVVHYAWTQHGTGSDPGDVWYSRSTDDGVTWAAPIKMNTDASPGNGNWMPSVTATASGGVLVTWYDGRNGTSPSCGSPGSTTPCYERWGRVSLDNGATWQADQVISDGVSGLPNQPDSNIQTVYEGDYDYSSSDGNTGYTTWNDGRTIISGNAQQDVYFDKVDLTVGTPTPTVTGTPPTNTPTLTRTNTPTLTPTPCGASGNYVDATGTATIVAGTTDTGNHADDGDTLITLPFTWQLYGQNYTTTNVDSNGRLDFVTVNDPGGYTNSCLPASPNLGPYDYTIFPYWDDQETVAGLPGCSAFTNGCGIFTSVSGTAPNRIFNIEWHTVYFANTAQSADYEVRLYEGQNRFDVIYGATALGNTSATSGVQGPTGLYTEYFCNGSGGAATGSVTYTQPSCATSTPIPTNTPTSVPPTNTPTAVPPTNTPTAVPPSQTPGGNTATPEPTHTTAPTQTPGGATSTPGVPTATPTACTLSFTDVPVGSTFYPFIRCLACKGIINGYPDGTFKPGNNVTRGQLSKIVSNSAGFSDNQTTQMFQDVPVGSTFFQYVGRLASRGFIGGYACGTPPAGACVPPGNLPYFLPNNNASRGQISKIVSNAAGFSEAPSGQQFQDVPSSNAFYAYIYRLVLHNVMSGYQCGTPPAGACVPPANRPYFLPSNNATRGQTSKIVANTFFPNCNPPEAPRQ